MYSELAFQTTSPIARWSGIEEKKLLSASPSTPMTAATGTLTASIARMNIANNRITAEPTLCAANPCGGSILMIRLPIVLMIRQPPT